MSPSASAAGSRADPDGAGERPISDSDVEVEYHEEEDMDIEDEIIEEIVEEEDDLSGSANSNDVCKVQEFEERDRTMGSGSSTTRESGTALLPSKLTLGQSHDSQKIYSLPSEKMMIGRENPYIRHEDAQILKSEKRLNFVHHRRNLESVVGEKSGVGSYSKLLHPMEQVVDTKEGQINGGMMVAGFTNPTFMSTEMVTSMSRRYSSEGGFNGNINSLEEVKQGEVLSENEKKRTASRSEALEMNGTSSSYCTDHNNEKKRPAVICDFFAKGWCIRGNKCRFLHVKDECGSFSQQPDGEVAAPKGKEVMEFDEGFMAAAERPISIGTTDKLPSAVGNMTSSSHVPSETNDRLLILKGENLSKSTSSISKQLSPFPNDTGSFQVVEEQGLGQHLPANDIAKPRGPVNPDIISSTSSFLSSSKSQSLNKPSQAHSLEGVGCRSDYATEYHLPPAFNPSFNTLRQMASNLSSYHSSNWTRSIPFGSSSSASPLHAQKLFAAIPPWSVSSPFLASEPEKLLSNRLVGPRQHSAHHKSGFSSDDWEPSVPFRPSFFLTSSIISSLQDQYDPLRDSIDSPKVGEQSSKLPFSAEGTSALNATNHQTYGDSTSTGTPIDECNGGKSTTSVIDTCHGVLNKYPSSQKDLHATDGKTEGNYDEGVQHGTMAKEEISSVASHVKGTSKVRKVDICDVTHHSDGSSSKRDLKLDRERRKDELDVKHKLDVDASKLTKSSKHFRAALVDLIKELLRPLWQEGRISKDVHNTIVKKAVEKVLSTLQPHQIPSTVESAQQYLSSSQAKISKLVEGYVAKYGKT